MCHAVWLPHQLNRNAGATPSHLTQPYELQLAAYGNRLLGWIDGEWLFDVEDNSSLTCGAVGLVVEEGHIYTDEIEVTPAAELF